MTGYQARRGSSVVSSGTGIRASVPRAGAACAAGSGTGTGRTVSVRPQNRLPVPPPYSRHTTVTRRWPLADFLELGAFPGAVPCARMHAKAVLWEWEIAVLDEAELVVSELTTNAIQASFSLPRPAVVRLWLLSDRCQVVIMVWDGSPRSPARPGDTPDDIAEGGRGLVLVEAASDQWSWYVTPEYGGKVVWASFTGTGAAK